MLEKTFPKLTGFVMPVGNGAVGKTSLASTLQHTELPEEWHETIKRIPKTKNLEFEYVSDHLVVDGEEYHILQQYLVPPGQKAQEGDQSGRSYEQVIDIFTPMIQRVDVVLLSYKITLLDTFHDLEHWIEKVTPICNDCTHFILVGTHLDQQHQREVMPQTVQRGKEYVCELVKNMRPNWKGNCFSLEVSNLSGENIAKLRSLISGSILHTARCLNSLRDQIE
jgi:GTPase SAR1 family protein